MRHIWPHLNFNKINIRLAQNLTKDTDFPIIAQTTVWHSNYFNGKSFFSSLLQSTIKALDQ